MGREIVKSSYMSLFGVISLGIGSMVGAGIFALLGQVVLYAGKFTYLAFIFAGITALLCGYSYAKLAQVYPQSGGIIDYFKHGFKTKIISSIFSFIYLFTLGISIAMLAKSFGIYITNLFNLFPFFSSVFGVAIILILSFLNLKNSELIGKTETILVLLKLSVLILLIFLGGYFFFNNSLEIYNHNLPVLNFWQAVAYSFFAFAGFGIIANAAGSVKKPKKIIPLAIFLSVGIVILLYLGLAFVVLNFVPYSDLHTDINTAVASASKMLLGKYGFVIMSITGLIALASGINALIFSSLKIINSMSGYKELPRILSQKILNKITFGFFALVLFTSLACIFLKFGIISKISSAFFLLSYMGVFITHFLLRKKVQTNYLFLFLGFSSMLFILIKLLITT